MDKNVHLTYLHPCCVLHSLCSDHRNVGQPILDEELGLFLRPAVERRVGRGLRTLFPHRCTACREGTSPAGGPREVEGKKG